MITNLDLIVNAYSYSVWRWRFDIRNHTQRSVFLLLWMNRLNEISIKRALLLMLIESILVETTC